MGTTEPYQAGQQASTYAELTEHAVVDGVAAKKVFPIVLNPLAQTNPSLTLSYDESGNLTAIEKVIGLTTYTKTLTYTDGNLTEVSVWA